MDMVEDEVVAVGSLAYSTLDTFAQRANCNDASFRFLPVP